MKNSSFFLSVLIVGSLICMEREQVPEINAVSQDEIHRSIVESLIKKHGLSLVIPALQIQIQKNGWVEKIDRLKGLVPDRAIHISKNRCVLNEPLVPQKLSLYSQYKSVIMACVILGATIVVWASYETVTALKKITHEEWQKASSWQDRVQIIASKTCLTKFLNRLR